MPTPHDKLFKRIFKQRKNAASALSTAMPKSLAERIDWRTLRVEDADFLTEAQRELRSDILFSVRSKGAAGKQRRVLIYMLVEHQSEFDHWMPLRMLGYLVQIWVNYVETNPRARHLPPIVPVVVYHDKKRWSKPHQFGELFDLSEELWRELLPYQPAFALLLDDLSQVDEAALWQRSLTDMARMALLLLKTARHSHRLPADLERWRATFERIIRAPGGVAAAIAFLSYVLEVGRVQPQQVKKLAHLLGPQVEEAVMTAAQKLIEQGVKQGVKKGIEQGVKRGIEEGVKKGRIEGQAEVLLRLLRHKFGAISSEAQRRVRSASPKQLERMADRIIEAKTLKDVLG